MALHFHWFLPTNGDGRDIVGGGHGVATGSAGAIPSRLAGLISPMLAAQMTATFQRYSDDLGGTTPFAPTSGPAHSAAVS